MSDKWTDRDRMLRAMGATVRSDDYITDVIDSLIEVCFRQEAELEDLRRELAKVRRGSTYNHMRDGARSPTPVERRY